MSPDIRVGNQDPLQPYASGDLQRLLQAGWTSDQTLSYCRAVDRDAVASFGASSLSTIIQMVANGLGITVLPEISLPFEVHDPRIALLRFPDPEPTRSVALAWRRSSPRKRDFMELGKLLAASRPGSQHAVAVPDQHGTAVAQ